MRSGALCSTTCVARIHEIDPDGVRHVSDVNYAFRAWRTSCPRNQIEAMQAGTNEASGPLAVNTPHDAEGRRARSSSGQLAWGRSLDTYLTRRELVGSPSCRGTSLAKQRLGESRAERRVDVPGPARQPSAVRGEVNDDTWLCCG